MCALSFCYVDYDLANLHEINLQYDAFKFLSIIIILFAKSAKMIISIEFNKINSVKEIIKTGHCSLTGTFNVNDSIFITDIPNFECMDKIQRT